MGAVWLARAQGKHGFEKLFAVKTIRNDRDPAESDVLRAMFLDEARVISHIHDDNVVEIVDLGEEGGHLFMVMEWVDGEPLTRYVSCGKVLQLPVDVAVRIILDACHGLHAAHEARGADGNLLNVVHRDVSPHNILVTAKGPSRVIDFGIAKARDRLKHESSLGSLKGKLRYMAPEQVKGRPVGRATDVFALGCVFYELLAEKPPFDADEDAMVIYRLLIDEPPAPLPASVPAPIADVIMRALALDPVDRFPSMDAMHAALEAAARSAGLEPSHAAVAAFTATHLETQTRARRRFVESALDTTRAGVTPATAAVAFTATVPDLSNVPTKPVDPTVRELRTSSEAACTTPGLALAPQVPTTPANARSTSLATRVVIAASAIAVAGLVLTVGSRAASRSGRQVAHSTIATTPSSAPPLPVVAVSSPPECEDLRARLDACIAEGNPSRASAAQTQKREIDARLASIPRTETALADACRLELTAIRADLEACTAPAAVTPTTKATPSTKPSSQRRLVRSGSGPAPGAAREEAPAAPAPTVSVTPSRAFSTDRHE
jgi:serine/threonine-protein kinase